MKTEAFQLAIIGAPVWVAVWLLSNWVTATAAILLAFALNWLLTALVEGR